MQSENLFRSIWAVNSKLKYVFGFILLLGSLASYDAGGVGMKPMNGIQLRKNLPTYDSDLYSYSLSEMGKKGKKSR